MGILRSDIVSHSQLQPTGSVAFDGTTDYLTIPASAAWLSGIANSTTKKSFTVEWWQYWNAVSGYVDLLDVNYTAGLLLEAANGKYTVYAGGGSQGVEATAAVTGQWYHYALVFYSGTPLAPGSIVLYRDGEVSASGNVAGNIQVGNSSTVLSIGAKQSNGAYSLNGYISNFRWCDRVVYNAPFTPPKFELTAIAGTQLLCCQSSSSVTEAAAIPGGLSITANGNAAASAFAPDIKKDNTDIGPVFEDNTKFDTLSYMVPPGGTTAQSNRGRGVFGGGYTTVPSGAAVKRIYYIQIDSMGTSAEFGDTNKAAAWGQGGCSSSTRGLFTGGTNPTNLDTIDYITIATTSNALDFGDLNVQHGYTASCSNNTRGLTGGGRGGSPTARLAQIDYNTIATLGNGQDFGDLTQSRMGLGAVASSTRAVFTGGNGSPADPSTVYNIIDYVEFATTANATDFGDMTDEHTYHGSCSSSTRGIIYGGVTSYGPTVRTNIIEYITIASTGNGTDFGDVRDDGEHAHGTSNSIRGVFAGGVNPYRNSIDFITITTTGNGVDWGDLPDSSGSYAYAAGLSDSHGGIS